MGFEHPHSTEYDIKGVTLYSGWQINACQQAHSHTISHSQHKSRMLMEYRVKKKKINKNRK